jgi:glycylpeptide N-tetradecanoyltransferase
MHGDVEIEKNKCPDEIPKEPAPLPDNLSWSVLDLSSAQDMDELYNLLSENYVEDGDSMFRFNYPGEFLRWALCPPGWKKEWHVGIRKNSGELVAFISAIPISLRIKTITKHMAEVNFLCVHKDLRANRLSPLLIAEITRRVHLHGQIFQAIYTAGALITTPLATGQYQ